MSRKNPGGQREAGAERGDAQEQEGLSQEEENAARR
jgi:hypothetical protein